jgi:hypothetical protein
LPTDRLNCLHDPIMEMFLMFLPDDYNIVWQSADALTPYANNPRTHSKAQIRQVADSIPEFR